MENGKLIMMGIIIGVALSIIPIIAIDLIGLSTGDSNATITDTNLRSLFIDVTYTKDNYTSNLTILNKEAFRNFTNINYTTQKELDEIYNNYTREEIEHAVFSEGRQEIKRQFWIDKVDVDLENDDDAWNKIIVGLLNKTEMLESELCKMDREDFC